MTRILTDYQPDREKAIVFANTGKEHNRTLEFVHECDKRWNLKIVWLEAVVNEGHGKGTTHKIVNFETASRDGKPFEAMIQKYGIPNKAFPHCTRELKRRVIDSYVRTLGWTDNETAIGIRADEAHRINQKEAAKNGWIYPLTEWGIDKRTVLDWWAQQDFDLGLMEYQGNCDLCWKKSDRKLVKAIREEPGRLDWWAGMERKYSTIQVGKRSPVSEPMYFFRGSRSSQDIRELVEISKRQGDLFLSEQEEDCFCKTS
jgi:3'-phosphoadenosine 5'-phosphosulfate sulfotransferase (PAPS reductase)/FAD synthetase